MKTIKTDQETPTQNNMVQSAIFKNWENKYWQEVHQQPLPETS